MASLQNTSIRRLTPDDFQNLKMFHVKHFQNYHISDPSFSAYLSLPQYETYGMFHVKHLIGYAVFLICGDDVDVVYICTHPAWRRLGVATALLGCVADRPGSIFLEVSVENSAAISFYEKLGFCTVSTRKKYLNGIDAYLMRKN